MFLSFKSQAERRLFGGSDFIELAFCRLKRGTAMQEIVSTDAAASLHWNNSSLYIYGENWNDFLDAYGEIITGGTYANLDTGPLDCCGINYFSPEQTASIMRKVEEQKPEDYRILLDWLEQGTSCNGFYVLGL